MPHTYLRDLHGTKNIISSTLISPPKWIRATNFAKNLGSPSLGHNRMLFSFSRI
jgi:hypothetical protein